MEYIDPAELRTELARRRWTRRRLGGEAGLSGSYVDLICRGYQPSARALERILGALGHDAAARIVRSRPRP